MDETPSIILCFGSASVKAGITGNESPITPFPNLTDENLTYFGSDARDHILKNNSKPLFPYTNGVVTNWPAANGIWKYTFFDILKTNPEEHSVLLAEPPFNPKLHREKICQIYMESYNVPAFYVGLSSLLTLYGTGRTSGMVINMGQGVPHAVPIIDGCVQIHAITRFDISGVDITKQLLKLSLAKLGKTIEFDDNFPDYSLFEQIDTIKCKYCHFQGFGQSADSDEKPTYSLPDGAKVVLSDELRQAPEIIFDPSLYSRNCLDLTRTLMRSIRLCEPEYRNDLYSKIVLAGGTSRIRGLSERLKSHLQSMSPLAVKAIISTVQTRDDGKGILGSEYADWVGGSIVAKLPTFQQMWVTRDEYNEAGPTIIHRKCL